MTTEGRDSSTHLEPLTWESVNPSGDRVVLTVDTGALERIRSEWFLAGVVAVGIVERPVVFEARGGGVWATDVPTGEPIAEVGRRRRVDLVWLPDGRVLRWLTPGRLYAECGFAWYDERRRRTVRNLVFFSHDGIGVVTADRRVALPAVDGFAPLVEGDLLLALGWFLLLVDRAGSASRPIAACLGTGANVVPPIRPPERSWGAGRLWRRGRDRAWG